MSDASCKVIFSWHMGIVLNPLRGSAKGAFDGEKFWRAWERGRLALDTFGPDWDFGDWWRHLQHQIRSVIKLRRWMRLMPPMETQSRASLDVGW